jgi:FtsH-binding integral membrane protein
MQSQMRSRVVDVDAATERSYLVRVYGWMTAALAITGSVAMLTAQSEAATRFIFAHPGVFLGLFIVEVLLVLSLAMAVHRLSPAVAMAAFVAYAAINGLTLSAIFLIYTKVSIATTFFVAGGTFGAMAIWGATTKRSLDGLRNFAMMGIVGFFIASIVNIFMHSETVYWLATYVGVLVFTALAAYHTQKIRQMRMGATTQGTILGALMLYMDFINLFLFLLQIFGDNRRR